MPRERTAKNEVAARTIRNYALEHQCLLPRWTGLPGCSLPYPRGTQDIFASIPCLKQDRSYTPLDQYPIPFNGTCRPHSHTMRIEGVFSDALKIRPPEDFPPQQINKWPMIVARERCEGRQSVSCAIPRSPVWIADPICYEILRQKLPWAG
jgi:hypothetical protein